MIRLFEPLLVPNLCFIPNFLPIWHNARNHLAKRTFERFKCSCFKSSQGRALVGRRSEAHTFSVIRPQTDKSEAARDMRPCGESATTAATNGHLLDLLRRRTPDSGGKFGHRIRGGQRSISPQVLQRNDEDSSHRNDS